MFASPKMKSRFGVFFIGLLILALLLAGCGKAGNSNESANDNAANKEKVVKDAMGHKVTIPAHPKRIIAPYLEDPLIVLGEKPVAQWSVANGIQDYLQAHLKNVPKINYNLPPEEVVSFNPDLIIVSSESLVQKGLYEKYSKIAPTYVLGDKTASDWRKTLLKLGELLNKSDQAKKALQDYDKKAAEAKEKLHQALGDKKVAILWLTQKQFYVVDPTRSSGAVLYHDLGLNVPKMVQDLPKDPNATWKPVSLEKLADLDADEIFLVNSDKGQGDTVLNNPVWKNLPAVKAGHVYEMSQKSSWLYSGLIANEQIIDDVEKALLK
ncbi:iron-hydroxamate ABC transporter substrate-binding protein [Caenibacillus caldisaponilyticus]|uniref:iron-hydroxamate ABC transporter substrate-binding protein n=1 Tax=Caenibacillus caldisaponilyticus TaxID=1674942 RepID=UPI001EE6C5AD|nr:iron-hydroxamate ABC transporter substrate-binding protein [Caenibacillus caldisaponilyticus]